MSCQIEFFSVISSFSISKSLLLILALSVKVSTVNSFLQCVGIHCYLLMVIFFLLWFTCTYIHTCIPSTSLLSFPHSVTIIPFPSPHLSPHFLVFRLPFTLPHYSLCQNTSFWSGGAFPMEICVFPYRIAHVLVPNVKQQTTLF